MGALKDIWSRMWRALWHDRREEVLRLLCREYLTQLKDAIQFRRHAEQMRYPHFRDKLLRIAEAEEKHAGTLKRRILALGGEIPKISPTPEEGWNNWEELRLDLDDERQRFWDLEGHYRWLSERILRRQRCCVIYSKTKKNTMKPSSVC